MAEPGTSLVARAAAEVVALHDFFQAWLRRGGDRSGLDLTRLEDALAPGFRLVTPQAVILDRAAVVAFVRDARGSRGDANRPFVMRIEELDARDLGGGLCLATYVERQDGIPGANARRASALFGDAPGTPGGVRWLHVHETWLAAPP